MADPPAPCPALDVRGLTTVFETTAGPVRAADDVSLVLGRGETLGLVGESGSGKSVTALSLVGLVPPPGRVVAGSVRLDGRELLGLPDRDLDRVRGADIGFVFQEPMSALNPVLTVGTQVAEALVVHGRAPWSEARRRAIDLLAAVRLADPVRRARDYPHQLSGGMRQRVLIAIALSCGPRVLIADEPTTALDVTLQADILDLLIDTRESERLSLLLITHDLGIVAQRADRVAVMYAGRLVEAGPVDRMFREPRHPYTRGLLAAARAVATGKRLHTVPGAVPNLASLPAGCAFAPRCPSRTAVCDLAPPPEVQPAPGESVRCHLFGGDSEAASGPRTSSAGPTDSAPGG